MTSLLRFLLLLDLLSLAAAFRLPEARLLGVITTDYVGFVVLYRLAQMWQARVNAVECRKLVSTYGVSETLAKKLVGYWGDRSRKR